MKQDYLWDKSGSDAEIEEFEDLLIGFRSDDSLAPKTEQQEVVSVLPGGKTYFGWRPFVFASFVVVLILFVGTLIWAPFDREETNLSENFPPLPIEESQAQSAKGANDDVVIPLNETTAAPIRIDQKHSKTEKKPRYRNSKPDLQIVEVQKATAVKLTIEEQYAYSQLMLALSITGSKLKYVKDAIEGIEKPQVILKKEDDTRRN